MATVKSPATLIYITEGSQSLGWADAWPQSWRIFQGHNDGTNWAFADGHVKWMKFEATGYNLPSSDPSNMWYDHD